MKSKRIYKLRKRIVGFFLALGIVGGVSAGLTVGLLPKDNASLVFHPSTDQNNQSQAGQTTLPTNLPAHYGQPVLTQPDSLRPLGGGLKNFTVLKNYAYKLNDNERKAELAELTPSKIEDKFALTNASLGDTKVNTTDKIVDATYNLVEAYDKANDDYNQVVAWKSKIQQIDPQKKETALIFFDGGPNGGPRPFWAQDYGLVFDYARVFMFNEPQYSLYPKEMVGKYGASAQGNMYFDKLVSTDKNKLQNYKNAYEQGKLEDFALFWALSGQLDLTQREMEFAASVAYDIVSAMRLKYLVQQLKAEGYEKVTAAGISFGDTALAESLLMAPETIHDLSGVSVSDNAYNTIARVNERKGQPINYASQWNNYFMGLTYSTFMDEWFNDVLEGDGYKNEFVSKFKASNVKDDKVVGNGNSTWDDQKYFWNQLGIHYTVYEKGGHGHLVYQNADLARELGLTEVRYIAELQLVPS